MFIVPSLYIRDGQTVALAAGGSPFRPDPVEMAKALAAVGAELVYIVDLNLPATGNCPNLPLIERIVNETGLKVQLTGNVRSVEIAEKLIEAGIERLILGTIAYQKPDFLKDVCQSSPGKIAVHIDVRGGKVSIKGWTVAANKTALDYAEQFKQAGVTSFIYSDVRTEGKVTIKDMTHVRDFLMASKLPIFHSVELSAGDELELVLGLESPKLLGTIFGKAMYSGIVDIASTITHIKDRSVSEMDEPTLIPD